MKRMKLIWVIYFLKASINCTMFSCFSILNIFTSLHVVFLTMSSSSDSLNFLIATVEMKRSYYLKTITKYTSYLYHQFLYFLLYTLCRKLLHQQSLEFHICSLLIAKLLKKISLLLLFDLIKYNKLI